jgi:SAM-dependent methyltransferase
LRGPQVAGRSCNSRRNLSAEQRLVRRATFDRIAETYDAARPSYPEDLVQDLIARCAIGPATRVLEIGPGTGQLTVRLAETGARIHAIELGENLATVAAERVVSRPNVTVEVADFDRWQIPRGQFDVVVAATSFHWLDPLTRFARCRHALKRGGSLAIIETTWGVRAGDVDRFFDFSQPCYEKWDLTFAPMLYNPSPRDVRTIEAAIADSGLFGEVHHRRQLMARRYSRAQIVGLISSYSNVQSYSDEAREGFLRCMTEMIEREFGDEVERNDLYDLSIAPAV